MSYLVKRYMSRKVPTIEEHASVTEAAKVMTKSGKGYIIVLREGKPSGIVTEHDFVAKVVAGGKDPANVSVVEIMSSPLITIDPDEDLLKASALMRKHKIRRLPVMKGGVIYGVITARDIAQRCGEYVDRATRDLVRWTPFFSGIRDS